MKKNLSGTNRLSHSYSASGNFPLPLNDDVVLVDLNKKKNVDNAHLKTKAKWSPYGDGH